MGVRSHVPQPPIVQAPNRGLGKRFGGSIDLRTKEGRALKAEALL